MSVRSLNTGYSALTAARVGIETASNNIANANTEGYTRQRLHLRPALPTSLTFGQIGNGVEFAEITRTRDAFLDDRVRGATASLQALQARTDLLNRAEATLGEPDFGISASLDSLWDSFEELRIDPTSRGSQVEVLHQLESLAARIRQIATEVNAVADSTRTALSARIDDVNAITGRIAHLNQAITRAGGIDGNPNNLLDRRDLAVDQLVELTGAKARLDDDGNYHISLSGLSLVLGAEAKTLTFDAATDVVTHDASGLGSLTVDLADTLNAQHALGFSAPGTPGGPLFSYNPLNPAESVAVVITDPGDLASSDADTVPYPAHNGENAMRLAELRTSLVVAGGTQSLTDLARQLVAEVGSRVAASRDSAESQADLATAARLSREQITGVSLDEEMVELMRYQQAYAAAARVITTADAALDILVNRTGLVGR